MTTSWIPDVTPDSQPLACGVCGSPSKLSLVTGGAPAAKIECQACGMWWKMEATRWPVGARRRDRAARKLRVQALEFWNVFLRQRPRLPMDRVGG